MSGKPGRQQKYYNLVIETVLMLHLIFQHPLPQTEGFIESLFHLIKIRLPIPDHTTLSRRDKIRPRRSGSIVREVVRNIYTWVVII